MAAHNTKKRARKRRNRQKNKYRVTNWSEYSAGLTARGSLSVWIDEDMVEKWHAEQTGKRGAQPVYSDIAILTTLQLGKVFRQRLRQTQGLVQSLFALMDITISVPNYSTLSRRGGKVKKVPLPKKQNNEDSDEGITIVIDSSGLKVYGEGEWKMRTHGKSKRRTWRKIHLSVKPDSEIRDAELTAHGVDDATVAERMLMDEEETINTCGMDGAYDKRKVYEKCIARNISHILIPPREDAVIWQHGNSGDPPHPRDENLRAIRKTTRRKWKTSSGYHIRSLAETAMFRWKTIFGERLDARDFERQKTEAGVKAAILNKMMQLGMPHTVTIPIT
jgi:hypothetical protein